MFYTHFYDNRMIDITYTDKYLHRISTVTYNVCAHT